jgi:hypothetical protein
MRTTDIKAIYHHSRDVVAAAWIAALGGCSHSAQVTSATADPAALSHFKTFAVVAPAPRVDRVAVGVTNDSDRVGGAIMDMDPMLATSLVGRAMRQDLVAAFTRRGYQPPDNYARAIRGTVHQVVDQFPKAQP